MKYSDERIVLYIDNDTDDCDFFAEALQKVDPKMLLVVANSGQQAIKFLKETKKEAKLPCLIVLDMNMPMMDGKKTFEEVKKDNVLADIPVIVFTTSSNKADASFWQQRGIEMVTKPHRVNEFPNMVAQMIGRCIKD